MSSTELRAFKDDDSTVKSSKHPRRKDASERGLIDSTANSCKRSRDRLHLAGPNQCEVLEPREAEEVRDRLGPDPILDRQEGREQFFERLQRRTIPVGKTCRRCGDEIVAADIDGRNVWWCRTCQPG